MTRVEVRKRSMQIKLTMGNERRLVFVLSEIQNYNNNININELMKMRNIPG